MLHQIFEILKSLAICGCGKSLADAKIQELEADAAKSSGDAKVEYEKTIKKLKEMRSDAAKKLDDLGNSSLDAWDAAKEGFVEAYKGLYDTYKEAAGKFK